MAVLALFLADLFFYLVAACIWMPTLLYIIPLYALDNSLIVYITVLTLSALVGTAIASVRLLVQMRSQGPWGTPARSHPPTEASP